MEDRGYRDNKQWESLSVVPHLSEDETVELVERLGIDVINEMDDELLVLCPFHGNRNTPSMEISKSKNLFFCFNGSCGETGTLFDLVVSLRPRESYFSNLRFIDDVRSGDSFQVNLTKKKTKEPLREIPGEVLERFIDGLNNSNRAREYLHSRGIYDEAIDFFKIGYSAAQRLIITPMFDTDGKMVGGIGRSIEGKVFKNIPGTKTSRSLFNIHNDKKSDWVIICESNFDAVRIHQAGYPNVVATLGGNFSKDHMEQIAYSFKKVVIMTDLDEPSITPGTCRACERQGSRFCKGHSPGRELGDKIANMCLKSGVTPRWAVEGCGTIYGEGIKDAGDMTDEYIRKVIDNNISNFEYNTLDEVKKYRR